MRKNTADQRLSQRTGAFAMRFDPRTKYMAELAARRERRSLTNFVEFAIALALRGVTLKNAMGNRPALNAVDAGDLLWDIDEVERFKKLQAHCPDLLSYEEQHILNAISNFMISGSQEPAFKSGGEVNWRLVKACWSELKGFVHDAGDEKALVGAIQANT